MNHPYHKIILFGDSITQMSFDPALHGFGANLANAYQRKVDVFNRGFSGYNTDWALPILRQLLPTVEDQKRYASQILLMTIFFGANDAALPFCFQHVPLEEFKTNLHKMLDCIKEESSQYYNPKLRVILVTPPPLNETMWKQKCDENGEPLNRSSESAKTYAAAVRDIGRERDVPVADIWTELNSQEDGDFSLFTFDGLHLNGKGNAVVHKVLMETIQTKYNDIYPDRLEMELPGFRDIPALILSVRLRMVPRPQLEIKNRSWICPTRPSNTLQRRVPLSNWDVVMFKSYTPILLFYNSDEDASDFMDTDVLKNSLSNVLCDFYPLAGRLVDVGHGRDEIDCNDAGVLFQEAFYQEELGKFRKEGYLPSQLDYHRMFPIHFYSSSQDPLLAIQVTRFLDGGVALGLMMLHKVADVYSTCLFLDAWSKSARKVEYRCATFHRDLVEAPPNAPITDEAIKYYRDEHRAITDDSTYVKIDPDQKKYARTSLNGPKPLKSVILEFYADGLYQCKKDAHTQDMINNKNWLSTKDALIAMLLRAIVRSRTLEKDEELKLVLGVNGRSKMKNSKEMESYFGNWMVARSITTTKKEISETSLVDTAVAFRQNIASLRASLFHGLSKLYTLHDDMTVNYLTYHPNSDNRFTASDVSVLPFWRLDFGYGCPERTRGYITSGGNGCMVIFGRDDSKKGPMYDVQLQMDADSMRRFIDDPDVKKYSKRILY